MAVWPSHHTVNFSTAVSTSERPARSMGHKYAVNRHEQPLSSPTITSLTGATAAVFDPSNPVTTGWNAAESLVPVDVLAPGLDLSSSDLGGKTRILLDLQSLSTARQLPTTAFSWLGLSITRRLQRSHEWLCSARPFSRQQQPSPAGSRPSTGGGQSVAVAFGKRAASFLPPSRLTLTPSGERSAQAGG